MISQYFQRNKGVPLLIKLAILLTACYLMFLALKAFAVVLSAILTVIKFLVLIALFAIICSLVLKGLFGINVLSFKDRLWSRYRHVYKYNQRGR